MRGFMADNSISRRALVVGAGVAGAAVAGRGLSEVLRPAPSGYAETLRALAATLTPMQRQLVVLPADDPTKQIANTIAVLDRPHIGTLLSPAQLYLVERLYASMLSDRGRQALSGTISVEGKLEGSVLAIYGEPERGDAHTVLSGGHFLVRGGGDPGDGPVLGGAVAYGHQIGDGIWRVRGNGFAYHGDVANRLFAALSPAERAKAVLPAPPHELLLQVQGAGGRFPGLRLGDAGEVACQAGADLLEAVLGLYPETARERARAAVRANGGVEALHIATYASRGFYSDMKDWAALAAAERARRGEPYWQVWRLEGPGTIIHFKGHPHVHAYLQIARDARRANIGPVLAQTAQPVEGPVMRNFLEQALRRATGEAHAFVLEDPPGRFCPGEITTGLVVSVDPFREKIVIATIEPRAMAAPLRARLGSPVTRQRVVTTAFLAQDSELFGQPELVTDTRIPMREAILAHLRAGGLRSAAAPPG
jgi:hypothetical protein